MNSTVQSSAAGMVGAGLADVYCRNYAKNSEDYEGHWDAALNREPSWVNQGAK